MSDGAMSPSLRRGKRLLGLDDQHAAHAEGGVVGDAAPEAVAAGGHRAEDEVVVLARLDERRSVDARAADPLQAQVVRVLAEVDELDDRGAAPDRPARLDEAELLRAHLDARGRRR